MSEMNGWSCALEQLKSAYKDESVISNLATVHYSDDVIEFEKKELVDIDENLSFRSCIPMEFDKYEVGSLNDEIDIDAQMPGIIDVSSIHDDNSQGDKMHLSFGHNYKLDISELEEKPAQSIKCYTNGYDEIDDAEDLSDGAGSGSETDESSIILNVWNEDYEGNPDPIILDKLMKTKRLPRNIDPTVVTRIKRAKIIKQIMELEAEESSQGSCEVMFDNICGPKFCANGDLTDEESLGRNSIVESIKQDSLAGSIDSEIFQFKRPKRSKYALIPDKKFNPKKSPEQLVLMLPKNKDELKRTTERDSFFPIQYSNIDDDDEDSGNNRTYAEKEMEFTLQKYDRTPGRIAQLVLSGKKSEAKVSYADESSELTSCNLFSEIPVETVSLDKYVLKDHRYVQDGDPIEGDRSISSHNSSCSLVSNEELKTPLSELVQIFSDPNFKLAVARTNVEELLIESTETYNCKSELDNYDTLKNDESFEDDSRQHIDLMGDAHGEDFVTIQEDQSNNRDMIETEVHEELLLQNNPSYTDLGDTEEPGDYSVETSCSENSDQDEVPIPSSATDADDIPLNPVGSSYSFKENCVCSMSFQTEIKKGKGFDESCDEVDASYERQPQFAERRSSLIADHSFVLSERDPLPLNSKSDVSTKLPMNNKSDASMHCNESKNVISECCDSGVPNSTTEDGVKDLIDALDTALQLQVTNTASYSTTDGEEVVIAMPVEGIIVEQPNSKYGRIIAPDEFEKLQSSYCESLAKSPVTANELSEIMSHQHAESVMQNEYDAASSDDLVQKPSEDFSIETEKSASFKTPLSADYAAFSFGMMQSPSSSDSYSPRNKEVASIREELEDELLQVDSMIADLKNESFVINEDEDPDSNCVKGDATVAKKSCLPKLPSSSKNLEYSSQDDLPSKQTPNTLPSSATKSYSFPVTSTILSSPTGQHYTQKNDEVEPSIIDDLNALRETMAKRRSMSAVPLAASRKSSVTNDSAEIASPKQSEKKPFQLYV
mmetsp:Transcript_8226/g.15492  ORF Transcript_8226/g.15492 Transcript_8226/m.15492 type:complete len:1002 (+) Transcript_8226:203-3208(+)